MEKVQVEVARAEVFGRRGEPSFQRIISRALGGMAKICSWTADLLAPEGLFVFQKSRRFGKEISDIHDSLKKLRLEVRDVKTLSVPHLDRHRYAVIIGKIKK
jgi:16S rRNA G527 N7-methylase RsmG